MEARRTPSGEAAGSGSVARLGRALLDGGRRSGAEGPSDCLSTAPSSLSNAGPLPLRAGRPQVRRAEPKRITFYKHIKNILPFAACRGFRDLPGAPGGRRQSPAASARPAPVRQGPPRFHGAALFASSERRPWPGQQRPGPAGAQAPLAPGRVRESAARGSEGRPPSRCQCGARHSPAPGTYEQLESRRGGSGGRPRRHARPRPCRFAPRLPGWDVQRCAPPTARGRRPRLPRSGPASFLAAALPPPGGRPRRHSRAAAWTEATRTAASATGHEDCLASSLEACGDSESRCSRDDRRPVKGPRRRGATAASGGTRRATWRGRAADAMGLRLRCRTRWLASRRRRGTRRRDSDAVIWLAGAALAGEHVSTAGGGPNH